MLSPLLFPIAVDVISENASEGLMNEILFADDLVLMSKIIKNLKEKFLKWTEAFKSKGLKVNLKKTKVVQTVRYSRVKLIHVLSVARE